MGGLICASLSRAYNYTHTHIHTHTHVHGRAAKRKTYISRPVNIYCQEASEVGSEYLFQDSQEPQLFFGKGWLRPPTLLFVMLLIPRIISHIKALEGKVHVRARI